MRGQAVCRYQRHILLTNPATSIVSPSDCSCETDDVGEEKGGKKHWPLSLQPILAVAILSYGRGHNCPTWDRALLCGLHGTENS
jgi:hypothetical protein